MSEEQEKKFAEECAVLLELAQHVTIKYGVAFLKLNIWNLETGKVERDGDLVCEIGFRNPPNKAVICK